MSEDRGADGSRTHPQDEGVAGDIVTLVQRYYQPVYRYAYRLTGNELDAEDLTQQTFLIAQSRLSQVRDGSKQLSWLFAVLRSCFLKSKRRPRPVAAANLELDVDEIPEHRWTEADVDREALQAALNDLPDEFRLVVVMFYFEELSYQEIAEQLDLPIGTVMSRLSRAKGRLRQRLFRSHNEQSESTPATRTSPTSRSVRSGAPHD